MARCTRSTNRNGAHWFKEHCNKIDNELKDITKCQPSIVMMTSSHMSSHGGCLSTSAITKIFHQIGDEVMRDATVFADFGSGLGQVTTYAWGVYKHLDIYAVECDEDRINFQRGRLFNYPYDQSRFNIVATDWTQSDEDMGTWDFLRPQTGYGVLFVNNLNMIWGVEVLGRLQHIIEDHAKEGTYIVTLSPMFGRSGWIELSETHHKMNGESMRRGVGIPICMGMNEVSWVGGETTVTIFVYRITR